MKKAAATCRVAAACASAHRLSEASVHACPAATRGAMTEEGVLAHAAQLQGLAFLGGRGLHRVLAAVEELEAEGVQRAQTDLLLAALLFVHR